MPKLKNHATLVKQKIHTENAKQAKKKTRKKCQKSKIRSNKCKNPKQLRKKNIKCISKKNAAIAQVQNVQNQEM